MAELTAPSNFLFHEMRFCRKRGRNNAGRDSEAMTGSKRALAICAVAMLAMLTCSAHAITGGVAARGKDGLRRSVVRIESALGEVCSGVLITPDVVLTAAHCVAMPTSYKAVVLNKRFRPENIAVTAILKHPSFVAGTTPHEQPGTDLALARLEHSVSNDMAPALVAESMAVPVEAEIHIAGYGTSSYRNKRSVRVLRIARLVVIATHQPPNNLVFAADRRFRALSAGASACLGDSGGPALVSTPRGFAVGGIISWAAGTQMTRNATPCGGITAITPLKPNSDWIAKSIEQLHR